MSWLADVGGIVAGIGGIASVYLAVKSMRLSREAQGKIDSILEDDRRYKEFVDRHTQRALDNIRKNPIGGTKRHLEVKEPENDRYIARALREGLWQPYGADDYYITK